MAIALQTKIQQSSPFRSSVTLATSQALDSCTQPAATMLERREQSFPGHCRELSRTAVATTGRREAAFDHQLRVPFHSSGLWRGGPSWSQTTPSPPSLVHPGASVGQDPSSKELRSSGGGGAKRRGVLAPPHTRTLPRFLSPGSCPLASRRSVYFLRFGCLFVHPQGPQPGIEMGLSSNKEGLPFPT